MDAGVNFKSLFLSWIFVLIFKIVCISASASVELESRNVGRLGLDLSEYGIDLDAVFLRLFSPSSLANQVGLTFTTTIMAVTGFIIAGILFQELKVIGAGGPFAELIAYFDAFLSPQSVVITVIRGIQIVSGDLLGRILLIFVLNGIGESITEIVSTFSLEALWKFLISRELMELSLFRIGFRALTTWIFYPLLTLWGPLIGKEL